MYLGEFRPLHSCGITASHEVSGTGVTTRFGVEQYLWVLVVVLLVVVVRGVRNRGWDGIVWNGMVWCGDWLSGVDWLGVGW